MRRGRASEPVVTSGREAAHPGRSSPRPAPRRTRRVVYGLGGNDMICPEIGYHRITVHGGDGRDQILGSPASDRLHGGAGNDLIHGGGGGDELEGDADDDELYGEGGEDELDGGAGNDELDGGAAGDDLLGDRGDDDLWDDEGWNGFDGGERQDACNVVGFGYWGGSCEANLVRP